MAFLDENGLSHFKGKYDEQVETTLNDIVAEEYSASKTYAVGDYVLKDGVLYRCTTAITTAEAWTVAHWTAAKVGSDLGDLKTALQSTVEVLSDEGAIKAPYTIYDSTYYVLWESGEISSTQSPNYGSTDYVDIRMYSEIKYKRAKSTSGSPTAGIAFYDANKEFISGVSNAKSQAAIGYTTELFKRIVPANAAYARFTTMSDAQTYGNFEVFGKPKVRNTFETITGYELIDLSSDGYCDLSGATYDGNTIDNIAYTHCIVDCAPGDVFTIFGKGGDIKALLWGFVDKDNNILNKAPQNYHTETGAIIVAPANSNRLIAQSNTSAQTVLLIRGRLNNILDDSVVISRGDVQSNYVPPYFTTNYETKRFRVRNFVSVKAGDVIHIIPHSLRYRMYIWEGEYGNGCNKVYDSGSSFITDEKYVGVEKDGFFYIAFSNLNGTTVVDSDYDSEVIILHEEDRQDICIMTYNTGDFSGDGYTSGTEELAIQYRMAIGEPNAKICFFQNDAEYFNSDQSLLPRNAVFGMYRHYKIRDGGEYNYMGFASDADIANFRSYEFTNYHSHRYAVIANVVLSGKSITLINVHLDWYDKTIRRAQIAELIDYIQDQGFERVIVAGDMNPSSRENGDFPSGASHYQNYSLASEDYAIWEAAGFKSGNAAYFGDYQTDMTYSDADDNGASAAWDNIIVYGDIYIKNVGNIIKSYMNDHAIFYAEISI